MPKIRLDFPAELDLTHFISAEAHDLRSPFNRILGFTKVVLKGMDGPLTDMQSEDLTTVYINSIQALNTINNLVDAARLMLKQKQPAWQEIKIHDLMDQAVAHWQQHHPSQEIEIRTEIGETSASLQGDENLLRLLLVHGITCVYLCIKDASAITLKADPDNETVCFTIHCSGTPLGEFQSGELTLAGYIFRNILDLHGGKVLCAEGDENGVNLQFQLPRVHSSP